ncbi:hypothetical protein GCM10018953_23920 [Streptosporangium nondiastaticum]
MPEDVVGAGRVHVAVTPASTTAAGEPPSRRMERKTPARPERDPAGIRQSERDQAEGSIT